MKTSELKAYQLFILLEQARDLHARLCEVDHDLYLCRVSMSRYQRRFNKWRLACIREYPDGYFAQEQKRQTAEEAASVEREAFSFQTGEQIDFALAFQAGLDFQQCQVGLAVSPVKKIINESPLNPADVGRSPVQSAGTQDGCNPTASEGQEGNFSHPLFTFVTRFLRSIDRRSAQAWDDFATFERPKSIRGFNSEVQSQ